MPRPLGRRHINSLDAIYGIERWALAWQASSLTTGPQPPLVSRSVGQSLVSRLYLWCQVRLDQNAHSQYSNREYVFSHPVGSRTCETFHFFETIIQWSNSFVTSFSHRPNSFTTNTKMWTARPEQTAIWGLGSLTWRPMIRFSSFCTIVIGFLQA